MNNDYFHFDNLQISHFYLASNSRTLRIPKEKKKNFICLYVYLKKKAHSIYYFFLKQDLDI